MRIYLPQTKFRSNWNKPTEKLKQSLSFYTNEWKYWDWNTYGDGSDIGHKFGHVLENYSHQEELSIRPFGTSNNVELNFVPGHSDISGNENTSSMYPYYIHASSTPRPKRAKKRAKEIVV